MGSGWEGESEVKPSRRMVEWTDFGWVQVRGWELSQSTWKPNSLSYSLNALDGPLMHDCAVRSSRLGAIAVHSWPLGKTRFCLASWGWTICSTASARPMAAETLQFGLSGPAKLPGLAIGVASGLVSAASIPWWMAAPWYVRVFPAAALSALTLALLAWGYAACMQLLKVGYSEWSAFQDLRRGRKNLRQRLMRRQAAALRARNPTASPAAAGTGPAPARRPAPPSSGRPGP